MVLVVSLAPQTVESCLRNTDRNTRPRTAEEREGGAGEEEFKLIHHKGLGLEHLPRRFIKRHGVCHPPPNGHPSATEKNKKTDCLSWLLGDEVDPVNPKDEYMLVRLPPYYKVKWNLKPSEEDLKAKGLKEPAETKEPKETKYNNSLTGKEKKEVPFNWSQRLVLR